MSGKEQDEGEMEGEVEVEGGRMLESGEGGMGRGKL